MATDPRLENQRQRYLDQLFERDGRNDPSHPHHMTYTGLYQQRLQQLAEADRLALAAAEPQPPANRDADCCIDAVAMAYNKINQI